jgi:hypothetical protein
MLAGALRRMRAFSIPLQHNTNTFASIAKELPFNDESTIDWTREPSLSDRKATKLALSRTWTFSFSNNSLPYASPQSTALNLRGNQRVRHDARG